MKENEMNPITRAVRVFQRVVHSSRSIQDAQYVSADPVEVAAVLADALQDISVRLKALEKTSDTEELPTGLHLRHWQDVFNDRSTICGVSLHPGYIQLAATLNGVTCPKCRWGRKLEERTSGAAEARTLHDRTLEQQQSDIDVLIKQRNVATKQRDALAAEVERRREDPLICSRWRPHRLQPVPGSCGVCKACRIAAELKRAWAALGTTAKEAADDPDTTSLADSIHISLEYERDKAAQALQDDLEELNSFKNAVAYELGAERNPDLALDALKARLEELKRLKEVDT